MSDTPKLPVFLIDGYSLSGGNTLAKYIASTYSFDFFNANTVLRTLFTNVVPNANELPALERETKYLSFLKDTLSHQPIVLSQLFEHVASQMANAKKPLVVRMTGITGFVTSKNIATEYKLFIQCDIAERAKRAFLNDKVPPTAENIQQMMNVLQDQDNTYTDILRSGLNSKIFVEDPSIVAVNTSGIPPEKVFHDLSERPDFTISYEKLKAMLPEVETEWRRWKCLVCGYVYEGSEQITVCPRCKNADPDKFADAD